MINYNFQKRTFDIIDIDIDYVINKLLRETLASFNYEGYYGVIPITKKTKNFSDKQKIEHQFDEILDNFFKNFLRNRGNANLLELNNSLDRRIESYNPWRTPGKSKNRDKARVLYVSPSSLPHGDDWRALGMYDPLTHTIYIANNLSQDVERFVYHHEIAHSLGIKDEKMADQYAALHSGYYLAA